MGRKDPFIVIMHGVSGSGKSTLARWLAEETGAVWISSDIERKQLFGLQPEESSSERGLDIYTFQANRKTFRHIEKMAGKHLAAGNSIILDATFLKAVFRKPFIRLAEVHQVNPVILSCSTSTECLIERVTERKSQGIDPSEADASVVRAQLKQIRPIPVSEGLVVHIDTQRPFSEQQQLALDGIRQAMNL
ncbi:AAA family ATPase [Endozoicomonadaceae bacterium StTr2]